MPILKIQQKNVWNHSDQQTMTSIKKLLLTCVAMPCMMMTVQQAQASTHFDANTDFETASTTDTLLPRHAEIDSDAGFE
ncbi:MAG: hypothetical protein Q8K36_00735, partial [Alphaproteobacteria bacterium]|nr:hypothetical protein [Alphaproteobacteria bacterium]